MSSSRPSISVSVPSPLRSYTDGEARVTLVGDSLKSLFREMDRQYPGVRFRMIDEMGSVRRHIKVYVNGDATDDLDHPLQGGDEVFLVAALSGG